MRRTECRSTDIGVSETNLRLMQARVLDCRQTRVEVQVQGRGYWASVASSCALQPVVGDSVLVVLGDENCYVLHVLERSETAPDVWEWHFGYGAHLHTSPGKAVLQAEYLRLQAQTLTQEASQLQQYSIFCSQVSNTLSTVVTTQQVLAQEAHHAYAKRYERVSGHHEAQMGSARLVIEKDWRVRAKNSEMLAQNRVRLDGKHVLLG